MDVFDLVAKLSLDSSNYEKGLSNAENQGSNFGGGLKTAAKVGTAAIAAVGTAAVATGTALAKGVSEVAEYGDNIDKMSQKMGISAEAYQEWDAVMQHSGTSIEALKPSMKTLANQAEKNSDAFQKLGISQEEVANLSQEDLFAKTIEGLQNMEEGTERTALTSQLLGRGATELGALLNTSAEETQAMKDRVHELGGVMSDEAVKSAAAFQDQLQDMTTAFDGLKRNMLGEFLPATTEVMSGLTNIFAGDFDSGLDQISEGVSNLADQLMTALPQALEVGVGIVEAIGQSIIQNIPVIMPALTTLVIDVVQGIIDNLPMLIQVGLQAIVTLAQGIAQSLPTLIPALVDTVLAIVDGLIDNIDMLVEAAIALILGLANGLVKALPKLIEKLPEIVIAIVDALVDNAELLGKAAIELIVTLGVGLVKAIPTLIKNIPTIIKAVFTAFTAGFRVIGSVGKGIVEGIWDGIIKAKDWLFNKLSEFVDGVVDKVKDLFGIHSPSTVFRDEVGKFLAQGMEVGFEEEDPMGKINTDINNGLKDINAEMTSRVSVVNGSSLFTNPFQDGIIDYDRLADTMVYALEQSGFAVEIDNREFGRVVRKVVTV